MELLSVCRIVELCDEKRANKHLEIGWKLLAVAPGQYEDGEAYHLYSLGWSSEKGDVQFPPDYW